MFKPKGIMFLVLVFALLTLSCSGPESDQAILTAEMPLHLEEHIDDARIEGSVISEDLLIPVKWDFSEPQPEWKATTPRPFPAEIRPAAVSQTDDVLKITLGPSTANPNGTLVGGAYVNVPEWDHRDWANVVIEARSSGPGDFFPGLNVWEKEGHPSEGWPFPYEARAARNTPLVGDGTVQTYQLPLEPQDSWEGPIRQLGLWIVARDPLEVEILSINVMPMDALYAGESVGIHAAKRENLYRRTLFVHSPAKIEYRVRVPEEGRLDTGLGALRPESPTSFRVTVSTDTGESETLLEENHGDRKTWLQRSIDLSGYAGQIITLSLEAESAREGSVALWGAPTLTGHRVTDKPNVIFYIIDGAGAEYMSVYGCNRRTTPNIERLAAEGAVFELAYSNCSWTRPSTASFMTSLQNSVLGGADRSGFNVVPDNAMTMAQHMHASRYQTAVFTANPNAGRMSGLERGVDFHQENWSEFSYSSGRNHKESSKYLHKSFWNWREAYPAEPYWVHFQTVDIHGDFPEVAPFGGLFVSSEELKIWKEWRDQLGKAGGRGIYSKAYEKTGLSRIAFYTIWQALYDEAMAYNDYQIGRLVERLKAEGEWENTLLIIAADHSINSAGGNDMERAMQESLPPRWNQVMFRPSVSRIPLIFVWPGHIKGGQRFSQPVISMVDVLPTILDLVGLPLPEVMQGQSLAPVLLGQGNVEPRPVILDEFGTDSETGELRGTIEVVDGRWGASLEINPEPPEEDEEEEAKLWRRPVPLLLYDLWNDPYCLNSVHEKHPDLVEKYTAFLEEQWNAHQALSQYFKPGKSPALTPEQLEMLRSLGYID